jgi:thiamine transport system substrate-binding protein
MNRPVALLLAILPLAGCLGADGAGGSDASYASLGFTGSDTTGTDAAAWPDLAGRTLTVLDHGAFSAFGDAARQFEALTGAKVVHVEADDTGSALNRAILERGSPSADVLYGVDNVLLLRAESSGILEPYTPLLSSRVAARHVFFDGAGPWPATPVDHGHVAVNFDRGSPALRNATIANLNDVRDHAGQFVTQDPNTSSVGLGFLLATVATYGETGWLAYWESLFRSGVTVTPGWSEAYEQHFSGGYGADPSFGGKADKAIVTSYTQSPAYEAFYGRPADQLAGVVTVPKSTFRQVQTMAILRGTDDLAAAQAWVEYTLTDHFQGLAAPGNAVYPVVDGIDVSPTYGGLDPDPATLEPAEFPYRTAGAMLPVWLSQWTDLCERHGCR